MKPAWQRFDYLPKTRQDRWEFYVPRVGIVVVTCTPGTPLSALLEGIEKSSLEAGLSVNTLKECKLS